MVELTIAEATQLLEPPIGERQLAEIIRALRIKPAGKRRTGHVGRPADTYDWTTITELHNDIARWLS